MLEDADCIIVEEASNEEQVRRVIDAQLDR
jgi:hypothetical protein